MNQYKINIKTVLNKDITVMAENEKIALDFLEEVFSRTKLLDFSNNNIEEIEAKIVEKNQEKIEEFEEEKLENLQQCLSKSLDIIREELPIKERKFCCPNCNNLLLVDEVIENFMS